RNFADLTQAKMRGLELRGGKRMDIIIQHKRGTPKATIDVDLTIKGASLHFDSGTKRLWTDGRIQLLALDTQPHPTKITAEGLEVQLVRDGAAPLIGSLGDVIRSIDRIVLKNDVDIWLNVEGPSGFLGSSSAAKKPDRQGTVRYSQMHIAASRLTYSLSL